LDPAPLTRSLIHYISDWEKFLKQNLDAFDARVRSDRQRGRSVRSDRQRGSIALESGLGLALLALIVVIGSTYAFQNMILQDDQRIISERLRAQAQKLEHKAPVDTNIATQEAEDHRYGFSHRSAAAAIWLKDE
jgi:hypothetical protein